MGNIEGKHFLLFLFPQQCFLVSGHLKKDFFTVLSRKSWDSNEKATFVRNKAMQAENPTEILATGLYDVCRKTHFLWVPVRKC